MTEALTRFKLHGKPQPWKRAGRANGHSYTPKPVKDWQYRVRQKASLAWLTRDPIAERFLRLRVTISLPLNKGGKEPKPLRYGDADNIWKGIADALQKIIIVDDSWFYPMDVRRVKGCEAGCTWIEVFDAGTLADLEDAPDW